MKSGSEAHRQLQREDNQRFSCTEPPAHLPIFSFHQVLRLLCMSCNWFLPSLFLPGDGWGSGNDLPWEALLRRFTNTEGRLKEKPCSWHLEWKLHL